MTTINVTAEHIANGEREWSDRCPIALAILETFPDVAGIAVDSGGISIKRREAGRWTEVATPYEAKLFIWDFDDGGDENVGPFSFDLDYPEVTA